MGFVDSATVYAAAVSMDLFQLTLSGPSALIAYIDDIFLAKPTQQHCLQDSLALLNYFAKGGFSPILSLEAQEQAGEIFY